MNPYDEAAKKAHNDLCEAREAYAATLRSLAPALPDGAPDVCVPSPWTDGAVICLAGDVPEGWEWHGYATAPWFTSATDHDYIVEARPPAVMPEYATERVPLAHVIGRTLVGSANKVDAIRFVWDKAGWEWSDRALTNGYRPLPVATDGTVEVLIEAPAPEPEPVVVETILGPVMETPEPAPSSTVTVTLPMDVAERYRTGSEMFADANVIGEAVEAALNEADQ